MRILALCWRDSGHPQGGGSERYLEEVTAGLVAAGHEVIFRSAAVPGGQRDFTRAGVSHQRRGGTYTVYLRALWDLALSQLRLPGAAFGGRVDVVLDTHNGIPFFAHLIPGVRSIIVHHHCHREQWPVAGPVISRLGWWLESQVSPRLHRRCDWVTVSPTSARELVSLGVPAHQIEIIENGSSPVPEGTSPTPADSPRLVVIARLVPHKLIEHAIDVVAALQSQFPGLTLDIIGDGWWREKLVEHVALRGVQDAVVFHGHLGEEAKYRVLSHAWVQLLPSRKEGWGIVVMEAARLQIPTIAYRQAGGTQDSIIDQHTGILVETQAGLTAATAELLASPERRATLGAAAAQRATEFTWEKTRARFRELVACATPSARPQSWQDR